MTGKLRQPSELTLEGMGILPNPHVCINEVAGLCRCLMRLVRQNNIRRVVAAARRLTGVERTSPTLHSFARDMVIEAERATTCIEDALLHLRRLSLDDFGRVMISLPDPDFPNLSELLPRMADPAVQDTWTGRHGLDLLHQTNTFIRQCENSYLRYTGRRLQGATILDFGCGYGRNIRAMYYYSDPTCIYGVDAWQQSLDICQKDGVIAHLLKSESAPQNLPVEPQSIDFGFAFSVFTHLSERAANACIEAIGRTMKPDGLFIATIRPVEYWPIHDRIYGQKIGKQMAVDHHQKNFAFTGHHGQDQEYGDASMPISFFDRPGWEIVGYDSAVIDPAQISVILRKVGQSVSNSRSHLYN